MEGTAGTRTVLGEPEKAIPALAGPLAVSIFVMNFNGMADIAWAAWLGGSAVAGLSLAYPLYATIAGIGNGLGIGSSAAIARSVGTGDRRQASRSASQSLLLALLFSLMISIPLVIFAEDLMDAFGADEAADEAVAYGLPIFAGSFFIISGAIISGMLRGEGAARKSMAVQICGAVTNMILDPVLMYGLGMGVAGAGVATVCAGAVSLVLGLWFYLRPGRTGELYAELSVKDLRFDSRTSYEILRVGLPEAAEYAVMSLINIPANFIIIGVGGEDVVGTYTSAWRVAYMVLIPAQAYSGAIVSVCSAEFARKRADLMRRAFSFGTRKSIKLTLYLAVPMALLCYPIAWVFTVSDDLEGLREDMAFCVLMLAVLLPAMSQVFVGSAYLQSIERSEIGFLSSLIRNIVMIIGYWLAAVAVGETWAMWVAMALVEIGGGLLMWALARRYIGCFCRSCESPVPASY
ncbi:MAG: MATE family efflux transporter [Methanomethylophilus sp.]|jgi:putative MATE family efflux protein